MSNEIVISAPFLGSIVALEVAQGDIVQAGDAVLVMEVMKVQSNVVAEQAGRISTVVTELHAMVEKGQPLLILDTDVTLSNALDVTPNANKEVGEQDQQTSVNEVLGDKKNIESKGEINALEEFKQRAHKTSDQARVKASSKRHAKGYRTARENLYDLCDQATFIEYGQFAVAAQRGRIDYQELQSNAAADGILTGLGSVNSRLFTEKASRVALIVNDYSVMAGTQGYFHHQKLDRMLSVAQTQGLPIIMYTEGGGGRPGETDITTVNSGLNCKSFGSWAGLSGIVPRIAVANGYNFAGNAALFGAADITIATKKSWVGMAGPAMITGGGLGNFKPTDIGPIDIQAVNGVVDIVADDETHATDLAKRCLAYFQGSLDAWTTPDQRTISDYLPSNRRFAYQVRDIINTLADAESFLELKQGFGGAIITGFIRLEGKTVGVMANDCNVLGGAIDVDAGEKASEFLNLCDQFSIPVVTLCDTPGFMVGPEHEQQGAVRRLAKLFTAGAKMTVPLVAIVLRKCYGLGAQAMLGGSTHRPLYTAAWPTGEFGAMGLEGAVELGFKKELGQETDPVKKQALFETLLAQQYERGQATEIASVLEIDAVIDPVNTRQSIISALQA